ncbi:hypothetical protein [Candidatus Clostridium radicumherbarum]|uniref:Restriction endonuclease type IV Mrr domain-containing protein n=1 Tax=Candidatus Clostridium radicumherbarum TaxID=3381662 RepID=A0ABW8TVI1_9CLOT
MANILDSLYYQLKKDEIEKASTILKMIDIETIFQNLSKLCWNYNIQWETIIKTNYLLKLKLSGHNQVVMLKYHKTDMVTLEQIDLFLNELDKTKANKGFYITTGKFERKNKKNLRFSLNKKDLILEDSLIFIKNNLGLIGKAKDDFMIKKLNFYKYLPK